MNWIRENLFWIVVGGLFFWMHGRMHSGHGQRHGHHGQGRGRPGGVSEGAPEPGQRDQASSPRREAGHAHH